MKCRFSFNFHHTHTKFCLCACMHIDSIFFLFLRLILCFGCIKISLFIHRNCCFFRLSYINTLGVNIRINKIVVLYFTVKYCVLHYICSNFAFTQIGISKFKNNILTDNGDIFAYILNLSGLGKKKKNPQNHGFKNHFCYHFYLNEIFFPPNCLHVANARLRSVCS